MTEPERTCIVTRRAQPVDGLVRFVLGPDDAVVPDLKSELPGRGVWVGAGEALVRKAVDKGLFARAFRSRARADEGLPELVGDLLRRRALEYLALANRAGLVVSGFAKVETVLARGAVSVLVEAADGSQDGHRKLRGRYLALPGAAEARIVSCFMSEQLSLALGRTNVVHAAVAQGPLADAFLLAARRYGNYQDRRD